MMDPLVPLTLVLDEVAAEPSDESRFKKCLNEKGFSSRRGSSGIALASGSACPELVPVDL